MAYSPYVPSSLLRFMYLVFIVNYSSHEVCAVWYQNFQYIRIVMFLFIKKAVVTSTLNLSCIFCTF